MTSNRMVSPSGAVTATTSIQGDEVQYPLSIDTSAGMAAVLEALSALEIFTEAIRDQFGVNQP